MIIIPLSQKEKELEIELFDFEYLQKIQLQGFVFLIFVKYLVQTAFK